MRIFVTIYLKRNVNFLLKWILKLNISRGGDVIKGFPLFDKIIRNLRDVFTKLVEDVFILFRFLCVSVFYSSFRVKTFLRL